MNKLKCLILTHVFLILWIVPSYGEEEREIENKETVTLDEIHIQGKRGIFVEQKEDDTFTGNIITKEGIETLGGPAQTSLNKAIQLLPSVNIESTDSYGLNRMQQGTSFIRVRGQADNPVALTLDGIPLETGPRFGPRENSFDMENFSSITLYRGAAPRDKGFSFGNYGGILDVSTLGPLDKTGFSFSESAGMYDFNRLFVRADSGQIGSSLKSFISYSNTTADKWCGMGGDDRQHFASGMELFQPNNFINAQLYVDYQKEESNYYRGLTYDQTKDLDKYYKYDYKTALTSDNTNLGTDDANYYKFNRIDDEYVLIHSNIQIKPNDNHTFTVKPYFSYDNVENINTSDPNLVQYWGSKRTKYGNIIDYKTNFFGTELSSGYWVEMFKWPYFAQKLYDVSETSTGEQTFSGWKKQLLTYDGYFVFQSPYIMANKSIGNFNANAGLKYFRFTQPKTTAYDNTSVGDVSPNDFDNYAVKNANACVGTKTTDVWLPSAGISYKINEYATPYFNYGRGYSIAYFGPGGLISGYYANKTYFDGLGITADDIADKQKIPVADNFDLGTRLEIGSWHITPTLFYTYYKDKSVTVKTGSYTYRQTVGEAEAYGSELEVASDIYNGVSVFASGSYNISRFKENVPAKTDESDIKGNQFPDCPEYMVKLGIIYIPSFLPGIEISPVARYIGERYGNITNTEQVSDYITGDINIAYNLKNISSSLKDLTLEASVLNVADTKYIASISQGDETRSSPTYYAGAPLTISLSIKAEF